MDWVVKLGFSFLIGKVGVIIEASRRSEIEIRLADCQLACLTQPLFRKKND